MTDAKDIHGDAGDSSDDVLSAADESGADSGSDGAGPGGSVAADADEAVAAVAAEADELREELNSLNDQHLRLAAEFDNYRKRNERDRQTLATRLQSGLVTSFLDVLDDLQRVAESDADARIEAVLEGVRLVEKKFVTVLEAAGLERVDAEGEPFDPEVMEALMSVPTDDPDLDEHVADVFQPGYRFRDTLLRPARVRVWQYDESESDQ